MSNKSFYPSRLSLISILVVLIISCNTTKEYSYSFKLKELKEKEMNSTDTFKKISRPISFPASKNIQITIRDYNPLKTEIIVEDSSSTASVGDTSKLASLIALPTLPKTGASQPALAADSLVTVHANVSGMLADSMDFIRERSIDAFTQLAVNRNNADCIAIQAYMVNLDEIVSLLETNTSSYKEFLSKIEIISDDYTFLKGLSVLTGSVVATRLQTSFLPRLNSILPAGARLNTDPSLASSRELSDLETGYFKQITDLEAKIDEVSKSVDKLKGNCNGFIELLKKFIGTANKAKETIKELKTSHTDKLLPSFNKKLLTYDEIKKYITEDPIYITKSIAVNKDFHSILVYTKEPGNDARKLYDNIDIEPTKGFKLHVAAGVFGSGLTDRSYSKKTKDSIYAKKYLVNGAIRDTTVMQTFTSLFEKKQSHISYGGMLYVQAHTQNASFINFGGYIGFGALFNDQTRWAGSAGGALIIGKTQKFGVHVGAIMAQVERLTPPYESDKWYPESIDNIPTYKAWDVSLMIGFSWSFK